MTTIRQYKDCSTNGLSSLDQQLIAQIQKIAPGLLLPFDCLAKVTVNKPCHAFLQPCAIKALEKAIAHRGTELIVNSAYRTLAQQGVLFAHFQNRRCGISAAARPGLSNHNSGLALDIEDAAGWRPYLERYGWDWIGSFDPMHFDFVGAGAKDIRSISIKAFQQLWNLNNPSDRVLEDGQWGLQTYHALSQTPCLGFTSNAGGITSMAIAKEISGGFEFASLRQGMRDEGVRAVQQALKKKNFTLTADGVFGNETMRAVKDFQVLCGLTADGVVGMETKRALGVI